MITRILIVRHAETIGNIEKRLTGRNDYELTEKGKLSTNVLFEELKDIKFDVAYASTEDRTKKTISKIATKNKLEIIKLKDLSEMYFGIYDGWKWEDVNKINPNIKKMQEEINSIQGIPEQESMEHVGKRMMNCIKKIIKENEGKTILIASHGVAIEALIRKITNVPFSDEREKYCQHNCAINEILFENGKFNIIRLADVSYL